MERMRQRLFGLFLLLLEFAFHVLSLYKTARNVISTERYAFKYRNVRESDLEQISELCAETFDLPVSGGSNLFEKLFQRPQSLEDKRRDFQAQLANRFENLVQKEAKHSMILAEDLHSGGSVIAGFVEIGMLPSPVPVQSTSTWAEVEVQQRAAAQEVPYLGNVAVRATYRRRSIAQNLIRISLKVLEKWKETDLFVAVSSDNEAALGLYAKLGFEIVFDERDSLTRKYDRPPRLYMKKAVLSALVTPPQTEIEAEEKTGLI